MAALIPKCPSQLSANTVLDCPGRQNLFARKSTVHRAAHHGFRCTKRHARCQAKKPTQVEAEAEADYSDPNAEPADREDVDLGDGDDGEDDEDELAESLEEGEQEEIEEIGEDGVDYSDMIIADDEDVYPMQATEIYTEEEYELMCDLPLPNRQVQQTLNRAVMLEGIAIHSNMLACIRVMPAFAGEGRYFVLVPPGSIRPEEEPQAPEEDEEAEEAEAAAAAAEAKTKKGKPKAKIPWDAKSDINKPDESKENPVPKEPDQIQARREDEQVVKAVLDNASIFPEDCLFTTLEQGGVKIFSAEALLATLEACGVDNARIEVEARKAGEGPAVVPEAMQFETEEDREIYEDHKNESDTVLDFQGAHEVPFADGSAVWWAQTIKEVGVRTAPTRAGEPSLPKKSLAPRKVVSVREGESFITLMPCDGQRISLGINYQDVAPVVGAQWASWSPDDSEFAHFRWSMAAARPFLPSAEEAFRRRAAGYYKGGLNAGLVATADWGTWIMPEQVRFQDEAVRRRLIEFIADMSLLSQDGRGGIPEGHVFAYQASKDLTLKFMRAVRRLSDEQ